MMTLLHFAAYFVVVVFLIAVASRFMRIAKMPVHLRWELYPVPHEKGRAHYGGSILEEVNWWTKPREKDHLNELLVMFSEIIFLKGVWEHNRKLWFGSFPLHFGLYLLIGSMGLLVVSGILKVLNIELPILISIIPIISWVGCIIGLTGSVIMLLMRMFEPGLSKFSTPSHFFNIMILGAVYLSGILWLANDSSYVQTATAFFAGLISHSNLSVIPTVGYWHIGFSLFFILYLPFTHMSHFFTKFFTYHSVRWEDEPNLPGGRLQKKIDKQLAQVVTWSAPHIGADGKKNWVDIATSAVPKKVQEK